MTTIKPVCSVIALFLFSTFAHSIPVDTVPKEESLSQSSVVPNERNWAMLENPISSDYQISASSGKIHSPFGTFDPLAEQPPLGHWQAIGFQRPYDARLHIVQSISPDLFELQNELISIGIEIIDHIPDDSVLISLPEETSDAEISRVQNLSQVRWAGPMPSTWKVSKSLLALTQFDDSLIDLDVTPSPTNSLQDLSNLDALLNGLEGIEHEASRCDAHLCQIKSAKPSLITSLASDHRITRVEPGPVLSIQNSNASMISGVDFARDISGANLTGLGEVIGISDTGLDADHGDFDGRLRSPIFNLFGPDNSGADSNSGHGTHVTSTLLGDGSGDSNSTGIVPEATFHFYQLEVDSSGILARWGSLYEMFEHSLSNDAYIHTNSWGSESLLGDYTSDSRSIDWFTNDYPEFLVIFSAGDMGVSGVTSPSTAKNALSVGASTTGAFGSETIGQIFNESSSGPTSDGRIKPDLVAPGVMICSARAQEADLATGGNCSNSMHYDGSTPMYMTLNGSSMATSVVAGASAMAREFLREEVGIATPGSDLIRALLVNGAEDIGEQDVPNSREGWGQLNISNSLLPKSNGVNLSVFYDQERQLMPGHSFIYTFEVSGGSGIDVTLAWNDIEGSASASQNASRLVNNLDLVVTSPTGEVYNGNNFVNGISQTTQFSDQLNNLERVRLPSPQSGIWSVQVGHAGGFVQDFSLVLAADAEELQEADLTVVANSIFTSENNPLKGDTFSMQLSWINQAAAATGDYSISLQDITDGVEIGTYSMPSLVGGGIETFSLYHSFSTTGTHIVRLTLDHFSEVVELNDENSGTNNNVYDLELNVTEIGVRITPLLADGSHPSDFQELESAKYQNIDPSLVSWAEFQLELLNEGTSEITVELSASAVQIIDESGIMNTPQDEWSRSLSENGPWVLSPFGEEGDRVVISLNLTDEDSDVESRFALPGLFVSDITLRDKMSPTIFHSIRLSVEIDRVEGLFTIPAGTESLGSEPNTFATGFTISVRNIGNGPTEYSISCETSDRWIVDVGSSQSSEITIGPLVRLQYVAVSIHVKIPPASSGLSAGDTNQVTCVTTSVNDPSLFTIETAEVEVRESTEFTTQISDSNGNEFGPAAISDSRAVLNGETVTTVLSISNRGNVPLDFQVRALSSRNTWPIQVYLFDEEPPSGQESNAELVVQPGDDSRVIVRTIVPLAAEKGDRNTITVKTTLGDTVVTNATVLEVREITTLDVQSEAGFSIALGRDGNSNIFLHNSGNVPLLIDLTMGTLPEGWSGGFLTGKTFTMDMNRDSIITIGLQLPSGTPVGTQSDKVPVIIESTSPSLSKETITVEMEVSVIPSVWIDAQSDSANLQGVSEGEESTFTLEVHNRGNYPSGVILDHGVLDGWVVEFEPSSIEELGPGEHAEIVVTVKPRKSAEDGLSQLLIFANSTSEGEQVTVTQASLTVDISKAKSSNSGGISGIFESLGLPAWTIAIVFFGVIVGTISFGIRARQEFQPVGSEEELIPRGSALQAGTKEERRAAALDTSTTGDVVTGEVSTVEIEDALQSTVPTLPTHQVPEGALPLPLTGLPDGWTMDQWVAYGHLWWEQNGP